MVLVLIDVSFGFRAFLVIGVNCIVLGLILLVMKPYTKFKDQFFSFVWILFKLLELRVFDSYLGTAVLCLNMLKI